jgi:hypothetical protein
MKKVALWQEVATLVPHSILAVEATLHPWLLDATLVAKSETLRVTHGLLVKLPWLSTFEPGRFQWPLPLQVIILRRLLEVEHVVPCVSHGINEENVLIIVKGQRIMGNLWQPSLQYFICGVLLHNELHLS